jgi:hypothetical protein
MFLLLPLLLSLEGDPSTSSFTEVEWEEVFFLLGDFLGGGEVWVSALSAPILGFVSGLGLPYSALVLSVTNLAAYTKSDLR